MSTTPAALHSDLHPLDLIARVRVKIIAINLLLTGCPQNEAVSMCSDLSEGLYFSLLNISDELSLALTQLTGESK